RETSGRSAAFPPRISPYRLNVAFIAGWFESGRSHPWSEPMALFGLLRSSSVNDPVFGSLTRSRGYWRGRAALGAHRDVSLLIAGGREAPDSAALAQARELPARYPALQGAIGPALFDHYAPYREAIDAGEIEAE